MISLIKDGDYSLLETKDMIKILKLDTKTFAMINAGKIGEIIVSSHKKYTKEPFLAKGHYRIYQVKNEPNLTDMTHLELFVGEHTWQGYLLPTGLPTNGKKRSLIIPSVETISR